MQEIGGKRREGVCFEGVYFQELTVTECHQVTDLYACTLTYITPKFDDLKILGHFGTEPSKPNIMTLVS